MTALHWFDAITLLTGFSFKVIINGGILNRTRYLDAVKGKELSDTSNLHVSHYLCFSIACHISFYFTVTVQLTTTSFLWLSLWILRLNGLIFFYWYGLKMSFNLSSWWPPSITSTICDCYTIFSHLTYMWSGIIHRNPIPQFISQC